MGNVLSANTYDFAVPKNACKSFETSYNNFEERISKLRVEKIFHGSIEDKNKEDLEKQKLISSLRNALSTKEFFRLYEKLSKEQLENTSDDANGIVKIVKKIKSEKLDLENDITGSILTRDSGEELYTFSENEEKEAEKFYKKVEKLINNYTKKNKSGKSKKIVYNQEFIKKNLDPISEDIKKIIFMSNYYVGAKGSTKIRKAANKVKNDIEKYNYKNISNITDDTVRERYKDLMINAPMNNIFSGNTIPTTYLEILRKILKITKEQYEQARSELKSLKKDVKRDTVNNSISLRDKVRTIRKFIHILEDFMPLLEKFMAENPKFSKIFKIKSKELLNLYENSAKLWSFLNSYEEITYGIKYGANEKKLRLFNKELDTYRKNISNLIITATKAKSIKKVSDCIEILNADCKNCCTLLEKIASSKKDMVKDTDTNIKYEDILQFEEDLNKLGVNIGKQVDLLQNKTEQLKEFMENYKKENSRTNKTLRIVKLVLSILGAFFGVSSALSGTIKNLATL